MKVILSVDPIRPPLTGIGRYTYELAKALQKTPQAHVSFLKGFRLQKTLPAVPASAPPARKNSWQGRLQKSPLAVSVFKTINPWLKGRALKGWEDHIYHGPNFYLPPFGGRSVVTIHDLSAYVVAESHPPERVRYLRSEIELSLKRTTAIITDTEYTRHEVSAFFDWPLDRIHSVPLACSPEFRPRMPAELNGALQALGLTAGGYTLFTGTIEPRKNLLVLLDAYSCLPEQTRQRWPLVITGFRGWNSEAIHARMEQAQRQGWLHYLGYAQESVLPSLIAGARLFAFPSLYEGFGLPVLEAMASAVPVVCSNASTLPEVAGMAAAFHAPDDVQHLTELLARGLDDDAWRAQAIESGLMQASKFSWQRCAEQTLEVYKTVAKN